MPSEKTLTRYAHIEGHTDLCYTDDGSCILTCGSDGDVRVWEGIEDDDPVSHRAGERAFAIAYKNGQFFIGTDTNTVQAYTYPEGNPDGIITRFTSTVTQICVNKDGTRLVSGACDMVIRVSNTVTFQDKLLQGHDAPVLSVALDPREEYVASSSCDGSVRVWNLDDQKCLKMWSCLPKSNDFSTSKTLCRLSWQPNHGNLAVPVEGGVNIFKRNTWEHVTTLKDERIEELVSVTVFSPCGKYLAAGTVRGVLVVWDMATKGCIEYQTPKKGFGVSAMAWNPSGKCEIAYANVQGQLGTLEIVQPERYGSAETEPRKQKEDAPYCGLSEDDFEDENTTSISKLKQEYMPEEDDLPILGKKKPLKLDDDDDSVDLNAVLEKAEQDTRRDDDDGSDVASPSVSRPPAARDMTRLQEPFQPGSTPVHLQERFMVWNSVGIVKCYNTEEENSIDVEFHDTTVHHAMHLSNTLNHTMATLSTEAVLFACEYQDDVPSKLVCMHFGSWDNCKEWNNDMPEEEEVVAITAGQDWVAAATDKRNLRLFTVSGVQREVLSIPGPVVCLAAHDSYVMVAYHSGMGVLGDQCLSYIVLRVGGKCRPLPSHQPLPLSPKSTLIWMGFTDEGTPCIMDSAGIIRVLDRRFGSSWAQVCNTKSHTKGKSDHYFIVGVSEIQQNIRCIPCKGSWYPQTLPRPAVTVLPMQLTLCEMSTEKGQLEESLWRSALLMSTLDVLDKEGYDIQENREQTERTQREALMKLFALACRTEREFRATEVGRLMPSYHTVQLAIKYASKLRRMQLAEKLSDVARKKMAEEATEEEEEISTFNTRESYSIGSNMSGSLYRKTHTATENEDAEEMETQEITENDEEIEQEVQDNNLFVSKQKKETATISLHPVSQERRNPFKKTGDGASRVNTANRGATVFDDLKVQAPGHKTSQENREKEKNVTNKSKAKQLTLFGKVSSGKENKANKEPIEKEKEITNKKDLPVCPSETPKKFGFMLWFEEHREEIQEENKELSSMDLTKLAMKKFRELSEEEKQKYKKTLDSDSPVTDVKKRKREEEMDGPEEKKTVPDLEKKISSTQNKQGKGSGISKLSAFAFRKPE